MTVTVNPRRVAYGHDVTVTGVAPSSEAGRTLVLELASAQDQKWRSLAATKVAADGRFRLIAPLRKSGLVKVLDAAGAFAQVASRSVVAPTAATASASSPQRVAVAAALAVPRQSVNVLGGQAMNVRGKLLPSVGRRRVELQDRSGGHWRTLSSTRTGPRGGFDLRYVTGAAGGQAGGQPLRVLFRGDRVNTRSAHDAGRITVYNQSVASWYDDSGSTACGFHANFGVANRSLPCGTQVTFRYGGHSVTATVDDRGPYVGGREWDLNQNTAAALGFGGVDTVWSTI